MQMMDRFDNIPELALKWAQSGKEVAIATVIETWGSAPRRVGSQLVIAADGAFEGSVSGGCVEGAVVAEAAEAMAERRAVTLEYGVSDGDAFAVGLACGGTIRILVEPVGTVMPLEILQDLVSARAARKPVAYVTGKGAPILTDQGYEARFRADRSGPEEGRFICIHNPPLRLVIVGAVHITQALIPMARIAGYDIWVIDPRDGFASDARFPDVTMLRNWPDEAMKEISPDTRTAVVLLTHDPKLDDPALTIALGSKAFYIGALGSNRTHAKRLERLKEAGFDDATLSRIHGPVGLNIGASNPQEIAISILAQMTQCLRDGS